MCAKQNLASAIGLAAQLAAEHVGGTPMASLRAATAAAESFVPGCLQDAQRGRLQWSMSDGVGWDERGRGGEASMCVGLGWGCGLP